MVKIESRMDAAFHCQACRTDMTTPREDLMKAPDVRMFNVVVKPIGSGNGTVFTFCREHLREFIKGTSNAGRSAMNVATRMDNMMDAEFEGAIK